MIYDYSDVKPFIPLDMSLEGSPIPGRTDQVLVVTKKSLGHLRPPLYVGDIVAVGPSTGYLLQNVVEDARELRYFARAVEMRHKVEVEFVR